MTLMECNAESAEDCTIFSAFVEQRWTILFRGPLILNTVKWRRYFIDTSCTKIYVEVRSYYSDSWPLPKLQGRPVVVTRAVTHAAVACRFTAGASHPVECIQCGTRLLFGE